MNEATEQATEKARRRYRAERMLVGLGDYDPRTDLFDANGGVPFGEVVGRNVKRLREERVLTQHELAQLWKRHGMNWARSKIAALESGARPQVSAAELVLMAVAFRVPLSELVQGPATGKVHLHPYDAEIQLPKLAELLAGGTLEPSDVYHGPATHRAQRQHVEGLFPDMPAQADVELAQRLGRHPNEVIRVAMDLFDGRSLTAERDRRVDRMGAGMTAQERTAHRGHVTRELSALIEAELERRDKEQS